MFKLTDSQVTDLARPLSEMLEVFTKFYENPDNVKGYREWYVKKFGCEPNI